MRLTLLFFLFTISQLSFAQRPKVGLVLSGGGAKGFAHIGVIRELEKAGIKPDIITGTSMGSIVGALYALGYTPDQMEQIVTQTDWENIISNKLPYSKVAMAEKPYDSRYITELAVQNGKIDIPKGLIEGKELALLMDMLTIPGHGISDFKQFPIPFACVATDITTGEAVVLDNGRINEAIRASMAIPSIFTPVHYQGRLLVDGGLVRNFPVQQAIDMGAEYIIGINVGSEFYKEEELNSMIDVLTQSAFVLSTLDTRKQKKLCDFIIEPNIKQFGTGDFTRGLEIVKKGQEEGKKHATRFQQLADSLNQLGKQEPINSPIHDTIFNISEIQITGNQHLTTAVIIKKLDLQKKNPFTRQQIIDHHTVLFGTKYFEVIHFNLIKKDDGTYKISVRVKENPDVMFKTAFHYDSENGTGINFNLTARNVLFPHSRLITEFDVATQSRAQLNYLLYLGKRQNKFLMLDGKWASFELPIYNQGHKTSLWASDFYETTLQFNKTIGTKYLFGGMAGLNYINLSPQINEGNLSSIKNFRELIPFLRGQFEINSLDHRYFSSKGAKVKASINYSNALTTKIKTIDTNNVRSEIITTEHQFTVNFSYLQNFPVKKNLTIKWRNEICANFSEHQSFSSSKFVGGFNPYFVNAINFFGAHAYEFQLNNVYVGSLGLQWQYYPSFYVSGIFNYAEAQFPFEFIKGQNFDNKLDQLDRRFGAGIVLAYNSPLGPISVSAGKDFNKSSFTTNFAFGFWFK
ncbi:FtsQ-type POTRA domain-containing protein [Cyclobacteriaceae bacterium]|nr:FtsQ-type POTRA domain-containing protein [Cyclobacteriaceae bacterium]